VANNAVEIKLFIDPSGAIRAVSEVGEATVKVAKNVQKETSSLTDFIRVQRAENRKQNFLLNESRQTIGALSLALTSFGVAGSSSMEKVTQGAGQALLAFQGFEFALSALGVGGPMGLAIAGVAALTTTIIPLIRKQEEFKKNTKELREEIEKNIEAWDKWQSKLKGTPEANRIASKAEEELLQTKVNALAQIVDLDKKQIRQNQIIIDDRKLTLAQKSALAELEKELTGKTANEIIALYQDYVQRLKAVSAAAAQVTITAASPGKEPEKEAAVQVTALQKILKSESELRNELAQLEVGLKSLNLTEFQRNKILERRLEILNELNSAKFLKPVKVIDLDPTQEMINKAGKSLREQAEMIEQVYVGLGNTVRTTMGNLFTGNEDTGKEFMKAIAGNFITMAEVALLAGEATAYAKAVGSFGLTLLADQPQLALGFIALEAARVLVNSLAQGGIAYGPALALVGDNPNVSNDPEVIAPLSKLMGIMQRTLIAQPPDFVGPSGGGYDFQRLEAKIDRLNRTFVNKKMSIAIERKFDEEDYVERTLPRAQRSIERRKMI
jgi:hypothetical protein